MNGDPFSATSLSLDCHSVIRDESRSQALSTSYPQPVPAGRRAVTVCHMPGLRGTVCDFQARTVSLGHKEKG